MIENAYSYQHCVTLEVGEIYENSGSSSAEGRLLPRYARPGPVLCINNVHTCLPFLRSLRIPGLRTSCLLSATSFFWTLYMLE